MTKGTRDQRSATRPSSAGQPPDDREALFARGLRVVEHPLIEHKLTQLRRAHLPPPVFRSLVKDLAVLLGYEALRDLTTAEVQVRTPLAPYTGREVDEGGVVLVPLLRAGLAMAEGMLRLVPGAVVGHFGVYRRETTLEPVSYYVNLPSHLGDKERIVVLDPMLATGGSASSAIGAVRDRGAVADRVILVCLLAAPEGVRRVQADHSGVTIVSAALDVKLDERGYIVPGLGDAGDRMFNTFH